MPRAPTPPSPPPIHTASTRRNALPVAPRAADGSVADPELERRWSSVKARLSAVLREVRETRQPVRTVPNDWVLMYSDVASLYTQNDALRKRRMYVYVRQFVRDLVASQLDHLRSLRGHQLLAEYCRTWRASMTFVKFMKRVLHHLHRFWIAENANTLKHDPVRPLDKLLMFYWREDLLSRLHNVVDIALELVDHDRRGVQIDHAVVRGVVDTLVEIGAADLAAPDPDPSTSDTHPDSTASLPNLHLYIRVFEDDFLALTRTFYKAEGEKMVAVGDVTKFMKSVLARLDEEAERGRRLLHPDSGPRLRQATEEQLIGNHKEYLQREATEMIKAGREDDLKLLYTLLSRVENGLTPLRTFFVGYVRAEGNSVVVDHVDKMAGKDDMQSNLGLVRVLVRLYRKHASLVKRCFNGSQVIILGIDDAFRGFANRSLGSVSLPNLIAHYVDHFLRVGKPFDRDMWDRSKEGDGQDGSREKDVDAQGEQLASSRAPSSTGSHRQPQEQEQLQDGSGAMCNGSNDKEVNQDSDDDAISQYMTELVRLFMYLDDKDLFFETHRRLFAKRLLATHDEDLEMRFIAKIKVQMGPQYTQRLSGMMKDKIVSNAMRSKFVEYLAKKREVHNQLLAKGGKDDDNTEGVNGDEKGSGDGDASGGVAAGGDTVCDESAGNGVADKDTVEQNCALSSDINRLLSEVEGSRVSGWLRTAAPNNANITNDKDKSSGQEQGSSQNNKACSTTDLSEALRIDFNAHVLNALHWPSVKVADLRVPPVLSACQQIFSEFYMSDKETRKLSWIHTLSTVHLTATLGLKRYTLIVSTFQACALLLFNRRDSISVGEACSKLNVSRSELRQHIKPLLLGRKCKILRLEKSAEEGIAGESEGDDGKGTGDGMDLEKRGGAVTSNTRDGDGNQLVMCPGSAGGIGGDRSNGVYIATNLTRPEPQIEIAVCGPVASNRNGMEAPQGTQITDEIDKGTTDGTGNDGVRRSEANENSAKHANGSSMRTEKNEGSKKTGEGESGDEDNDGMRDCDVIHLNTGFRSKLHRVVVPASIAKLASADAAVSKRNVVVDRSTQVDATLVRILKAKKEITHAALSAEVIAALAPMFLPDPRLIKSRLERLIDQEYVERDANDARLYRYSA